MNYLRNCAVLGLVVLLTFSGTTFASAQVSDAFVPSTLCGEVELMPYPTLAGPVALHVVGPSGEFNSSQEIESASSGIAILNWTHTPGVELQYNTSGYQPQCMEYAYFGENFSWDHTVQPIALNMSADLQLNVTGSFKTDIRQDMFSIQVWLLGDAIQKRQVGTIYWPQGGRHYSAVIFPSDFHDAFNSLIQSPSNQVQLAVALIPSALFFEDQGTHPWTNYTGSVQIITREIHLNALYSKNTDLPHVRTASYNTTWRQGDSDNFVDSCMSRDGSLYILSHQHYNNFLQGDTLTEVNSKGEILWRRTLNNTDAAFWIRVMATSVGVFLLGRTYLTSGLRMVIDTLGENHTLSYSGSLNLTENANLGGMAASSDGYLYIATYDTSGSNRANTLLKAQPDGTVVWQREFVGYAYGPVTSVQTDDSGDVFTVTPERIIKWSSQGDQLWEINSPFSSSPGDRWLYVLSDGASVYTSSNLETTNVTYIDPQGNQGWSFNQEMHYTPGWREYFYLSWVTDSPSGLIYALYTTYNIHQSSFIVVMNKEGLQVENYTASFSRETFTSADVPNYRRAYITDNDVMYLVGRTVNENGQYSLTLAIYGQTTGDSGASVVAFTATSAAAVLLVGAVVYLEHYRKSENSR